VNRTIKTKHVLLTLLAVSIFALAVPDWSVAQERQGRLQLGVDIGPVFETADSTAFGLALHSDYFFHQNFSLGPLVQFGFTDDLFQVGPSVQLKYTFALSPELEANLQGGVGFMYANLDRHGRDRDDTSFLFPVGGGLAYKITENVSIGTTLLFNFTDLDKVRNENFHVSLLGGLQIRF
jgi:hypothetical protein